MKRPFLYIAIPFSLGISFSHFLKVPIIYFLTACTTFALLTIYHLKNRRPSHINLYLAIFFLGAAYHQNSNILPADHISNIISQDEKKVFLRGVIFDDPIIDTRFYDKGRESFILNVYSLKKDSVWKRASGLVKVDIYNDNRRSNFGDELVLEGLMAKPTSLRNPGLFDWSKYLATRGIYAALKVKEGFFIEAIGSRQTNPIKRIAYYLRRKMRSALDEYFDKPFNGFLKSIIIGDRSELAYSLKEDFIKTGTIHIVAISGLNVGLIASLFLWLFSILRFPRRPSLVLTTILLSLYSFVAGSNPPIVRATIMFSILVLGYVINRDVDILNSLSIAAVLILLWNPKELFDPGFQLSFASIASTVLFAPKIDGVLGLKSTGGSRAMARIRFYILKGVSVSIAAWLGVWPFVSRYFNIISPIAIIANLIAIPTLFVLMAGSFLFLFISLSPNLLAICLAKTLSIIQNTLFFINHRLAELPLSYFRTPSPPIELPLLYYGLIMLLVLPKAMEFKRRRIHTKHILIVILLFFNIFIWKGLIDFRHGELKVTFLDVGQGDSILIEFPKKGHILIDGGSGGEEDRLDIGRSVIAPYLWNEGITRLDAIMVTHFHEDHLGGILYILNNFDVGCVIDNGAEAPLDNRLYHEYRRCLKERRIRHLVVGEGDEIAAFDDARLYILNPKKDERLLDSNDNSIVLKLVYKRMAMLFCGDIQDKAMERLFFYGGFLKSDILKVPHHGGFLGDEGIVKKFFKKVSAKVSIISVGRRADYRTLLDKTLNIITSLNSISYKTKDDGAIKVLSDGDSFKGIPFVK